MNNGKICDLPGHYVLPPYAWLPTSDDTHVNWPRSPHSVRTVPFCICFPCVEDVVSLVSSSLFPLPNLLQDDQEPDPSEVSPVIHLKNASSPAPRKTPLMMLLLSPCSTLKLHDWKLLSVEALAPQDLQKVGVADKFAKPVRMLPSHSGSSELSWSAPEPPSTRPHHIRIYRAPPLSPCATVPYLTATYPLAGDSLCLAYSIVPWTLSHSYSVLPNSYFDLSPSATFVQTWM